MKVEAAIAVEAGHPLEIDEIELGTLTFVNTHRDRALMCRPSLVP